MGAIPCGCNSTSTVLVSNHVYKKIYIKYSLLRIQKKDNVNKLELNENSLTKEFLLYSNYQIISKSVNWDSNIQLYNFNISKIYKYNIKFIE